ncbi:hypothetical protein AB0D57_44940 [Streptomyces sp. NPDC048275]|uniref:hypothetical protein n=1 Tax=Streptomyces sp. NPDC048275 TaxID=3155629 RepID=UPI003401A3E9
MSRQEVEYDTDQVRELLGRAVDIVPEPSSRGSEAVFAQASRVRWRRRAAATGVAAAAVATGLAFGPGPLSNNQETSVANAPTAGEFDSGAARIEKLLPSGIGKIREVSPQRVVEQVPNAKPPKAVGPYDGDYAVSRDGGTGYLTVHMARLMEAGTGDKGIEEPCKDAPEGRSSGCTSEELDNGSVLSIWQLNESDISVFPTRGKEFVAVLYLTDGTILQVWDSAGHLTEGHMVPLLKTPPLTRDQLRTLVLNPELLP